MLRNKRLFLKNHQNIICHQHQLFFCESLRFRWDEMQHLKNPEARSGTLCGGPRNFICRFVVVASKPTFQMQVQGEDKQPEEQAQWRIFMDFTDSIVVVTKHFKAITVSLYNLYCKQHMPFVCKCGADLLSLVDTDVDLRHPLLKGGQKQRRTETWCWSFKSVRNPKRFL